MSGPSQVTEGEDATFSIAISRALEEGESVSVDYDTVDGFSFYETAQSPQDYTSENDTATFSYGGPTSISVTVSTDNDSNDEASEYFRLELSNEVGASLGTDVAAVEIKDDDPHDCSPSSFETSLNASNDTGSTVAPGGSVRIDVLGNDSSYAGFGLDLDWTADPPSSTPVDVKNTTDVYNWFQSIHDVRVDIDGLTSYFSGNGTTDSFTFQSATTDESHAHPTFGGGSLTYSGTASPSQFTGLQYTACVDIDARSDTFGDGFTATISSAELELSVGSFRALHEGNSGSVSNVAGQGRILIAPTISQIVTQGSHGTASIVNGQLRYTADEGATATTDTVTYEITDYFGRTATATATVTIDDSLENTPPVVHDLQLTTSNIVDGSITTAAPIIQWTVSDATPHDQYDVDIDLDNDGEWDLFLDADGQLEATMQQDLHSLIPGGSHTISVRAVEFLDTGTEFVAVEGEWSSISFTSTHNRLPVGVDDTFRITNEGGQVSWEFDVLKNDFEPDGNTLTIASPSDPANGTVEIENGKIKYTPDDGFSGDDTFTYTAVDDDGGTATATVTVWVNAFPPDVEKVQFDDLPDDAQYDLLHAAAVEILGQDLGEALLIEQGHNAVKELIIVTSWGWTVEVEGWRDEDGEQIDTVAMTIRVATDYYEEIQGEFSPETYTTSELADQLNDLLFHEQITQFNRGYDQDSETPVQAFVDEFLEHPGTRIAAGVAVAALAVATGGLSLPVTSVAFSAAGLAEASAAVGAAYAIVRAADEAVLAAGEWTGVFEEGDRSLGEAAIDYFTNNPNLTDDYITTTDLSVTIVELGTGGFLFLKGKKVPDVPASTKVADDISIDWAQYDRNYCFPAGTPIHTSGGTSPIESIMLGQDVRAFNFESGEWETRTVTNRIDGRYTGEMVSIEADGSVINVTAYHPFWVIRGSDLEDRPLCRKFSARQDRDLRLDGRWVNSHDVRAGDVVYDLSGHRMTVQRVSQVYVQEENVYNLTVEGLHNYAVGEAGVLAHNTSICGEGISDIAARIDTPGQLDNVLEDAIAHGVPRKNLDELIDAVATTKGIAPSAATAANVAAAPNSGLLNTTRLSAEELATGQRLEQELGILLKESPHVGSEYIDDLGKTYDACGVPQASQNWNRKNARKFMKSIEHHLRKSNDFTALDLTGFDPSHIAEVEAFLSTLSQAELDTIIRIGF